MLTPMAGSHSSIHHNQDIPRHHLPVHSRFLISESEGGRGSPVITKKFQRQWVSFRIYFPQTGFSVYPRLSQNWFCRPPGWPLTHRNHPARASVSHVLGLKACAATTELKGGFLCINLSKMSLSQNMPSVGRRDSSAVNTFGILPDGKFWFPGPEATFSPPITAAPKKKTPSSGSP